MARTVVAALAAACFAVAARAGEDARPAPFPERRMPVPPPVRVEVALVTPSALLDLTREIAEGRLQGTVRHALILPEDVPGDGAAAVPADGVAPRVRMEVPMPFVAEIATRDGVERFLRTAREAGRTAAYRRVAALNTGRHAPDDRGRNAAMMIRDRTFSAQGTLPIANGYEYAASVYEGPNVPRPAGRPAFMIRDSIPPPPGTGGEDADRRVPRGGIMERRMRAPLGLTARVFAFPVTPDRDLPRMTLSVATAAARRIDRVAFAVAKDGAVVNVEDDMPIIQRINYTIRLDGAARTTSVVANLHSRSADDGVRAWLAAKGLEVRAAGDPADAPGLVDAMHGGVRAPDGEPYMVCLFVTHGVDENWEDVPVDNDGRPVPGHGAGEDDVTPGGEVF